jgi:hypothetical protein
MRKNLIFVSLLFSILAFLAFMRTTGADHVRAVQIVDLIATGVCLGIGLAHLGVLMNRKSSS